MFPYYELLQSNGTCNSCGENERNIRNLNNPSLMAAYYANWALLMKRLGPGTYDSIRGFGQPALVNIEPDLDWLCLSSGGSEQMFRPVHRWLQR